MLYWISWHQPTEDYRPLTDPPHPQVMGWWCSGYDAYDIALLCACAEQSGSDGLRPTFLGSNDWRELHDVQFHSVRDARSLPRAQSPHIA